MELMTMIKITPTKMVATVNGITITINVPLILVVVIGYIILSVMQDVALWKLLCISVAGAIIGITAHSIVK